MKRVSQLWLLLSVVSFYTPALFPSDLDEERAPKPRPLVADARQEEQEDQEEEKAPEELVHPDVVIDMVFGGVEREDAGLEGEVEVPVHQERVQDWRQRALGLSDGICTLIADHKWVTAGSTLTIVAAVCYWYVKRGKDKKKANELCTKGSYGHDLCIV